MLDKNGKEIIKGADCKVTFWTNKDANEYIVKDCYIHYVGTNIKNQPIVFVKMKWTQGHEGEFGSCLVYSAMPENIEIIC